MAGAMDRMKRQSAMVWWGAMMPHAKKPPTFDEFVNGKGTGARRRDIDACIAAWDRIDMALARRKKAAAR